MANLFRYQFRRLFKNKSLYISSIITSVIIILYIVIFRIVAKETEMQTDGITSLFIKQAMGNGMFTILAGIAISIFATEDYNADTIKNIYSKGYSKSNVFVVNYFVSLSSALILLMVEWLITLLFGSIFLSGMGTLGENYILSLLVMVIIAIGYHGMFYGLSMMIRKTAGAVAVAIAFPLVMSGIILALDSLLLAKMSTDFKLNDYTLDGVLSALSKPNVSWAVLGRGVGVGIGFTAFFTIIAYLINQRRSS